MVAEGVESAAELAVVRECGCDESQGFFHARPMLASELADWLRDDSARLPAVPADVAGS